MRDKILVVVDMQKDFTTGVLGNPECFAVIDKINELLKTNTYTKIIFTRDTHHNDYLATCEGTHLPIKHCIENTDGWNIVDILLETAKEQNGNLLILNKPTFGSVELGEHLRKIYADGTNLDITFVGVCTGICVINNVSITKAFCPNANVHVISDACACVTPESHKTALDAMKTFQIDII